MPPYHFTFQKDWRHAPLAYWVHLPVPGTQAEWSPPAPQPVPHRGYPLLCVPFEAYELQFSAPAQLAHCIEILAQSPLPTTRRLSQQRGSGAGPNGHWLSRLPAALKSPRRRGTLVRMLRAVQAEVAPPGAADFLLPL